MEKRYFFYVCCIVLVISSCQKKKDDTPAGTDIPKAGSKWLYTLTSTYTGLPTTSLDVELTARDSVINGENWLAIYLKPVSQNFEPTPVYALKGSGVTWSVINFQNNKSGIWLSSPVLTGQYINIQNPVSFDYGMRSGGPRTMLVTDVTSTMINGVFYSDVVSAGYVETIQDIQYSEGIEYTNVAWLMRKYVYREINHLTNVEVTNTWDLKSFTK